LRVSDRSTRYGMDDDGLQEIDNEAGGRCQICGATQSWGGKALATDHRHVDGQVRGLLCARCNLLIGQAGEDAQVLRNAAEYLEQYN
jgi:hypothetical protein